MSNLFSQIGSAAGHLAGYAALAEWLTNNRSALIAAIQHAQIEQARAMLDALCKEQPAVAGVLSWLMEGDVDTAIVAIQFYDPVLAAALGNCKTNFAQLQSAWTRSQP